MALNHVYRTIEFQSHHRFAGITSTWVSAPKAAFYRSYFDIADRSCRSARLVVLQWAQALGLFTSNHRERFRKRSMRFCVVGCLT